jgi:zinc protease
VTIVEPNRTEEKRFTEYAPNVPLPAVAITYLAPAAKSKDIAALQIASTIMSGGESSRLYQQLVYSQSIAQNAWSELDTRADVSLFKLMAILAGDKKPEEAEKGLLTELKKMQTTLVSAKELAKAKNQLITNTLSERETVDGKAMALGIAEMWTGAAANANKSIAELQAVTARDVQRVMKQYFNDKNRVVIYYLNEKEKK